MDTIAKDNLEQFIEMDQRQRPWFDRVNKYERRMQGEPWNANQIEELKEKEIEPIGFNLAIRTVSTMASNLHSDKSGVAFVPVGESDKNVAYLLQALIDSYREFVGHNATLYRVLKNQVGIGVGMFHVDRADNPFGTITRFGDFNQYRWDSGHNSMYWDDLQRLMYYAIIPVREAISRTGVKYRSSMEGFKHLMNMKDDYYSYFYEGDRFNMRKDGDRIENRDVVFLESYEKKTKDYEELLFPESSEIIPILPDDELQHCEDEDLRNAYSYYLKVTGDAEYAQDRILELKEYGALKILPLDRIIKRVSIGGVDVGEYTLPCKRFPVIPYIFELLGYPEGIIRYVDPLNQALNQTLVLLINNGRLLSNPLIVAQDGVINHKNLVRSLGAPYGLVTYKAKDTLNPGASEPKIYYPQGVGSHFTELMRILQDAAEQDTGIYGAFQGNPGAALETHSTTTALNSLAGQKLIPLAKSNQKANTILAEVEKDFIVEYADYDLIMRLKVSNDELFKSLRDNGVGFPEDGGDAFNMMVPVNKRIKKDGKRIILNNLKDARNVYNVVAKSAPLMHSIRERMADDLRLMLQQMSNPDYAKVAWKWLMKITDAPFAQEMAREIDAVEQLNSQLLEANELIKKLQSDLLNSQKKQATAEIGQQTAAIVQHAESKFDKLYNDFVLLKKKYELAKEQGSDEDAQKIEEQLQGVVDFLSEFLQRQAEVQEPTEQETPKGVS